MAQRIFTGRNSLAGSAARESEREAPATDAFRVQAGSAARAAEAEASHAGEVRSMRLDLRARGLRGQAPARLFPGPSARPALTPGPVESAPIPPLQQAPYPDPSTPGPVTSIGARLQFALKSLLSR